jgi:hypothetical protein
MTTNHARDPACASAQPTFEQWLSLLDKEAQSRGVEGSLTNDTGADCWRDYFDDGYTPAEALDEDWSHD